MIVERSMNDSWLSNTYLVAAGPGSDAFLVDAGGPMDPLFAKADEHGLNVTHILLTHHHGDHVAELGTALERWPNATVLAHPEERVPGTTGDLNPGDELRIGGLTVKALHTPGHTAGMLALLVERSGGEAPGGDRGEGEASGRDRGQVFTGDTLFKGSVGGVRAPGSTSYADLKSSVMDTLLTLPPETVIRPGHTDPSTVAEELEHNPFVRIWRGLDEEGAEPCRALGKPATLILWGTDYDGGHKAWIRWPDGSDDIVGGSRVER
jgi:glyoxylase-like metal-dependent hydrolase (beta-lactamase superfamily II)